MKDNYDINNYTYDMDRCIGCKGCVWVDHIYMPGVRYGVKCPSNAYKLFDSYAPMGRLKVGKSLLEGSIDYSGQLQDIIFECNLCGACDVGCKRNLDLEPISVLESLRVRAVKDGKGHPAHKKVADNINKNGNRYGAPAADRLGWKTADIKISDKADIVYFPGCASSYADKGLAQATAKILNKAGVQFMTLGANDSCCGHPATSGGLIDQGKSIAQKNINALLATGATTILTSCAECYYSWKVEYPKLLSKNTSDMGYKVVHLVELVSELVKSGKLTFTKPMNQRVVYHDACKMARMGEDWTEWDGTRGRYGMTTPVRLRRRGEHGLYQQPRDILAAIPGLEQIETPRMKENTFCCGAGGGAMDAYPDYASATAVEKLTEVGSVAGEAVISACPYCKINLNKASSENSMNIKAYDISEIILACL